MVSIITNLLAICVFTQVFYWYYFYSRLLRHVDNNKTGQKDSVTVLICVHNEEDNIEQLIEGITNQDYPNYEVLIVDDYSSDRTADIIKKNQEFFKKLKYIKNDGKQGKKGALIKGLNLVKSEWILLTDADCMPGRYWIQAMMSGRHSEEDQIVLGYSPYKITKSILSKWIHFEGWITAIQYMSYAKAGFPYMGVGRNLMYQKKIISVKLIKKYDHLVSGDDDLTVMQLADAKNTSITLNPKSFVWTTGPKKIMDYYNQKRRHYSTASYYKFHHMLFLFIYTFSQVLFYILFFYLMVKGILLVGSIYFVIRILIIYPIARKLMQKMNSSFNFLQFIMLDLTLALYYLLFSTALLFPKKETWN